MLRMQVRGSHMSPNEDLPWGDRPLPEDKAIHDTHPTVTGNHGIYMEAMRMVGAKRSKGALVDLVNWLLWRINVLEARLKKDAATYPDGTAKR